MDFKATSLHYDDYVISFNENNAPDWLTSCNTVKGSTMDMRWFWTGYVLTLEVGESIDTDFQKITWVK